MSYEVVSSKSIYRGKVLGLRADEVRMPDGSTAVREVVENLGAVAVVAYDDAGRVALIRQYRHPVGRTLWELPAGLLDVPNEPAVHTAARELFEEAHLAARTWNLLLDINPSPGFTNESVRIFLARDITDAEGDRYAAAEEEAELELTHLPLDEAVTRVLAGQITNSLAVAGLLAAARARDTNWSLLRPPDSPWPDRPTHG
jgi:8-oxo-dGTP pyrophosphatase MutT (NUDIX family)